jgi:outer membrane protein assembly factor BamB
MDLRAIFMLTWLVLPAAASDDWPQFRGPSGQGLATASGLPLTWSETENVAWKVPVPGRGWSSPVVLGDQVWMTTAIETASTAEESRQKLSGLKHNEVLAIANRVSLRAICLDRTTGKLLRDVELFRVDRPEAIHQQNSYASPTPFMEPGRVWCEFGTYGTACLDAATGEILWRRRLPLEHECGPASSPVLYKDLLVLVRDGCDQQYIIALDKHTGATAWKTDRPPIQCADEFKKTFSSPLVVQTSAGEQMIVPGAQWVVSYEPATGKPIWQVEYGRGYSNISRPVFGHGMVYVITDFPGQQLWAIRADGRGNVTESHVAWKETRQVAKRSSPLLVGDELYFVSDGGVAACLDARTGKTHWRERISGNYAASPVYADGRIHFFSQEGKTTVFRPGIAPAKLAENHLDGRIVASPAFVGKAIFLRTELHLYRIEKQRPLGDPRGTQGCLPDRSGAELTAAN